VQAICFFTAAPKKIFTVSNKRFSSRLDGNNHCGLDCAVTYFVLTRSALGSEEHVYNESGLAEVHSLREKAVREDIAERLGKVCSHFSADEFESLVAVMAARQVKCERRATW
jgi:hypothetical protein